MTEHRASRQPRPAVPAVERTLRILELLSESEQPLSLTQVATRTEVPMSTCSAIMRTLETRGYARERVRGSVHHWQPTLATYKLGARVLARLDLAAVVQPHLQWLAEEVGLPAHAGVLENGEVVCVANASGTAFVQFHTARGSCAPWSTHALGTAIVAHRPPSERAALIGSGPHAAPRRRTLLACARTGWAVQDDARHDGIASAAAPVIGAGDICRGGIAVTGFCADIVRGSRQRIVAAVSAAAARVSAEMGSSSAMPHDVTTSFT